MEEKNNLNEKNADGEEEKVSIRHTITAEETFTLAKDVYDIRCFIKNVYNNRAVISRRLNWFTLIVSLAFTLLYVAYILFTGVFAKLHAGAEIALFCLLGVYGALVVLLVVTTCCAGRTAKNAGKVKFFLKLVRLFTRLVSVAVAIVAIVFAKDETASSIAFDTVLIVFSIITLVVQIVPLLCGGLGKLARWLLSPVKTKHTFSQVALEWYELTVTGGGSKSLSVRNVSEKYYERIGVCLDNSLIPMLGKKYVTAIKPVLVLNAVESVKKEDRELAEGILKNVFGYAAECGYVTFDPCRDLQLTGTLEEEKPKKKTVKQRFFGLGKKLGSSILNRYIDNVSDKEE